MFGTKVGLSVGELVTEVVVVTVATVVSTVTSMTSAGGFSDDGLGPSVTSAGFETSVVVGFGLGGSVGLGFVIAVKLKIHKRHLNSRSMQPHNVHFANKYNHVKVSLTLNHCNYLF